MPARKLCSTMEIFYFVILDQVDEPLEIKTLGCFDKGALGEESVQQGDFISPQYCIGLCYGQGFKYAGVTENVISGAYKQNKG